MIQIHNLTTHQTKILDLLWKCSDMEEVDQVVAKYGHDAVLLKELILLECQDETVKSEIDCGQAKKLLSKF